MNHRQVLPERRNEDRVFFEETRVFFEEFRVLVEDLREARVLLERINQSRAKLCELRARRADLISRDVNAQRTVDELDESIEGLKAAIVELIAKFGQHVVQANARHQHRIPK